MLTATTSSVSGHAQSDNLDHTAFYRFCFFHTLTPERNSVINDRNGQITAIGLLVSNACAFLVIAGLGDNSIQFNFYCPKLS